MLESGFILLTVALLIVLHFGIGETYKRANYSTSEIRKKQVIFWGGFTLWIAVIYGVSLTGFFKVMSVPPRIPLLIILPLFAFTFWFLLSGRSRTFIQYFPKQLTVYYQCFRILVEILILGLFLRGYGPSYVTFQGYNFDIVFGFSALVIGFVAFRHIRNNAKILLLWNFAGLGFVAVVVTIFMLCFLNPQVFNSETSLIKPEFGTMPFLLLPAFLMPSAVFMHVLAIRKLVWEIKTQKAVTGNITLA